MKKSFIFGKSGKIIEVLKGIDLTITAGEMLAIEGASGAGKSTLLHILGALDRPTEGKVYFQDLDLLDQSETDLAEIRNRYIGFVFQFHHLLPEFTALENTIMPGLIQGMGHKDAVQSGERILVQLGLGDRLLHKPGELSGGEQQRVAVARALMMNPQVILADEPTGNLDSKTGEEVHNLLVHINREQGITIIVVTHNPALAVRMNRRVLLVDGKLHENS
ncbi:MAG: ABC transporter ATP-binding protein [Deltaproteobacteria bacterium]|nr:ABC transporter ATP-binding protein [Deltaproteobacteria bacterium]MDO9210732.1 ABC transporter ATP-binding protein [Deltaproteobacteria bacterium]